MYDKETERPSDARRAYLREVHHLQNTNTNTPSIILSNFCPIQRYYTTADKVLDAFLSSYEENNLDDAYVLGKRFTSFSMDTLPTHSYYNSSQDIFKCLRNDNIRKVGLVADALEDISKLMDKEEVLKAKREIRRREESAKEKIMVRRKQMIDAHRLEKEQVSLEDKLNQWNLEYPKNHDINEVSNHDDVNNHDFIEIPPPSYDEIISNLSPRKPPSPTHHKPAPPLYPFLTPPIPSKQNQSTSIKSLKWKTKEIYQTLLETKQVQIFNLSTHQGKNSTNGCTVIAPLIAIQHLSSTTPTLPDVLIEEVIDTTAPPVLQKVRNKLGLEGNALIIPSDVHDYFIECGFLHQDQFIGVAGGNILSKDHLTSLFHLLNDKCAATLYFHEHVISLLKIQIKCEEWYDVIDSMPRPNTATRTRCKTVQALECVLMQYAFEKLNQKDWKFLEECGGVWREEMADLDPRVFQAFVWSVRK